MGKGKRSGKKNPLGKKDKVGGAHTGVERVPRKPSEAGGYLKEKEERAECKEEKH